MKSFKITCPKCGGPVWEEDIPTSEGFIDLVCIICGLRKFYPSAKYYEWKKKAIERIKVRSLTERALSA